MPLKAITGASLYSMKHISINMNFPAVQGQKSLVFGLMNDMVKVYEIRRQHKAFTREEQE